MTSLSKTMKDNGKEQTSSEPNKVYIVRKVLRRAIQNVISVELSHCIKSYGHLCQIYQNHSPNMVMSCDPGFLSSENFYFLPNSILNFRKNYQILGNWLKNKKVTGKKQIGGWKRSTNAYKVKDKKVTGKRQIGGLENTPPPSAYRFKL